MAVNGVGNSGVTRAEQIRTERRTEENNRAEEQREKVRSDQRAQQARQPQESGRGESVDMTA